MLLVPERDDGMCPSRTGQRPYERPSDRREAEGVPVRTLFNALHPEIDGQDLGLA